MMLLKPNLTGSGGGSSVFLRHLGMSPVQCGTLCQDGWLPGATTGKNPGWKDACWFLGVRLMLGVGKVCSEASGLGWAVSGCKVKLFYTW